MTEHLQLDEGSWVIRSHIGVDPNLFDELLSCLDWKQETINVFGPKLQPRLTAWLGSGRSAVSGYLETMNATPWLSTLLPIKAEVERLAGTTFSSCLANLYRDGNDSVGWHSDDEKSLGRHPTIASVSFGETRRFLLRSRSEEQVEFLLSHGDVLVMGGTLQENWKHCVPKSKLVSSPRINLTFRNYL